MAGKKRGPLIDLRNDLQDLMNQVQKYGNEALNEASDMLRNRLEQNTPILTGATAADWKNTNKYNMVKYIFNDNPSKSGIPILYLLEFGSKGHPFAIRTFRDCMDDISNKIVNGLNKVK